MDRVSSSQWNQAGVRRSCWTHEVCRKTFVWHVHSLCDPHALLSSTLGEFFECYDGGRLQACLKEPSVSTTSRIPTETGSSGLPETEGTCSRYLNVASSIYSSGLPSIEWLPSLYSQSQSHRINWMIRRIKGIWNYGKKWQSRYLRWLVSLCWGYSIESFLISFRSRPLFVVPIVGGDDVVVFILWHRPFYLVG